MNTDALDIDSFETLCRRARPHSGYCHIAHRYICIAFFNSILLLYCWRNSVHSHVMCWCLRRISFVVVGKTVGQNRRNTQANWRALAHLHINTSKQNIWFTRRSWKTSCRYYNISCFCCCCCCWPCLIICWCCTIACSMCVFVCLSRGRLLLYHGPRRSNSEIGFRLA